MLLITDSFILSSLLWGRVEHYEHKSLKRVFRGLPLYSTYYILSSFHPSESHRLLCAINVHEHIIMTIDPYSADSDEAHLASETTPTCVKHMFEKHDSNYEICRDWTIATSIDFSARLNLAGCPRTIRRTVVSLFAYVPGQF